MTLEIYQTRKGLTISGLSNIISTTTTPIFTKLYKGHTLFNPNISKTTLHLLPLYPTLLFRTLRNFTSRISILLFYYCQIYRKTFPVGNSQVNVLHILWTDYWTDLLCRAANNLCFTFCAKLKSRQHKSTNIVPDQWEISITILVWKMSNSRAHTRWPVLGCRASIRPPYKSH